MPEQSKKAVSIPRRFIEKYFSAQLDLRVRLFNVLAMAGIAVSLISAIVSLSIGESPINAFVYIIFCALSAALLRYSYKSGRYQFCYLISIFVVFFIGFPVFFFLSGAYYGSVSYFFIFAIVFTVFMLEGKKAIFIAGSELLFYTAVCVCAYRYYLPGEYYKRSEIIVTNCIFGFVIVGAALGVTMFLHFRLYNAQQKRLDEQNAVLAQANRMKTEFLANASHEMRTPLTVTSVNVQTVMEILEDMGETANDPETVKLLQSAQSEIMRLSRMVGGMLTLASMSESTDRRKLDLAPLLHSGIEMLRLNLGKRGNAVETNIEPGLSVFGNADLLAQVLSNILQNSGAYTENGTITVSAKRRGNNVTVEVRDTGSGISPELLPSVFLRGASTGGTGFGLYLCKTVVESHGGRIWIESELQKGTAVFYSLPFYEGQLGGAEL